MDFENKEYGLVLGGGAARGLHHIGVLKFLEEEKISPVEVVGTSMGSIIGTLCALGYTSDNIVDKFSKVKYLKLIDPSLSRGILKGEKIYNAIYDEIQDKTFADTKIPLKIIATNIITGEKVVFNSGKLIDAIMSSISVPGIFVPYKYNNSFLVDGGLVSNLPVGEATSKNIIAVSAIKEIDCISSDNKKSLTQKFILERSLNILENINQKLELQNSKKNIIYISFPNDYGYLQFGKLKEMVTDGFIYTQKTFQSL